MLLRWGANGPLQSATIFSGRPTAIPSRLTSADIQHPAAATKPWKVPFDGPCRCWPAGVGRTTAGQSLEQALPTLTRHCYRHPAFREVAAQKGQAFGRVRGRVSRRYVNGVEPASNRHDEGACCQSQSSWPWRTDLKTSAIGPGTDGLCVSPWRGPPHRPWTRCRRLDRSRLLIFDLVDLFGLVQVAGRRIAAESDDHPQSDVYETRLSAVVSTEADLRRRRRQLSTPESE